MHFLPMLLTTTVAASMSLHKAACCTWECAE